MGGELTLTNFIELHRQQLAGLRRKAAKTVGRLSRQDLAWRPNVESNSVANLVFHLNGLLRWRVGEDIAGIPYLRDRDGEFNANGDYGAAELLQIWDEVFSEVDRILAEFTEDRLTETVTVRGQDTTLAETLVSVTAHVAEHVGQMIYIAKLRMGAEFKTLTIPHKRPD